MLQINSLSSFQRADQRTEFINRCNKVPLQAAEITCLLSLAVTPHAQHQPVTASHKDMPPTHIPHSHGGGHGRLHVLLIYNRCCGNSWMPQMPRH
jgi:hypothetical protein